MTLILTIRLLLLTSQIYAQVIPITDSMREPHKFPAVLSGVMIFLLGSSPFISSLFTVHTADTTPHLVLFGGAGALSYLAFGSDVQTVVLVNLDSRAPATQAVQFLYSLAILLSVPLQLFPAVRIMENALFGQRRSGKAAPRVKWAKNAFRAAVVLGCTALSWAGAADLDKFVAFVGSFAWCVVTFIAAIFIAIYDALPCCFMSAEPFLDPACLYAMSTHRCSITRPAPAHGDRRRPISRLWYSVLSLRCTRLSKQSECVLLPCPYLAPC